MKSLKERLEEKIEVECKKYCDEHSNYEFYGWLYKAGATSLVPLIVELAEALQEVANNDDDGAGGYYTSLASESLYSIEKFLVSK